MAARGFTLFDTAIGPCGVVALPEGRDGDLSGVTLDLAGVSPFDEKAYALARAIRPGETLTYGELAPAASQPAPPFAPSPFAFDPDEAVRHLREKDFALARLMDAVGPFRMELKATSSLFGALAEAIVYQQLTGKAAATIFGRVRGLFPGARAAPTADQIHEVAEERLREAGLSRAKALALKDLARRAREGTLPTLAETRAMDDDAIVARLTEVRGVGRWTAQMLLMFRLGRPDVLPGDDYGLRKGYAVAFRKRALPDKAALEKHGAKWKPFRTVASWYLWRANERPPR